MKASGALLEAAHAAVAQQGAEGRDLLERASAAGSGAASAIKLELIKARQEIQRLRKVTNPRRGGGKVTLSLSLSCARFGDNIPKRKETAKEE